MPLPMVADDLAAGRLVQIMLEGPGPGLLPMQAIYKADSLPGPAARWLLDRIRSSANTRLRDWVGLKASSASSTRPRGRNRYRKTKCSSIDHIFRNT